MPICNYITKGSKFFFRPVADLPTQPLVQHSNAETPLGPPSSASMYLALDLGPGMSPLRRWAGSSWLSNNLRGSSHATGLLKVQHDRAHCARLGVVVLGKCVVVSHLRGPECERFSGYPDVVLSRC